MLWEWWLLLFCSSSSMQSWGHPLSAFDMVVPSVYLTYTIAVPQISLQMNSLRIPKPQPSGVESWASTIFEDDKSSLHSIIPAIMALVKLNVWHAMNSANISRVSSDHQVLNVYLFVVSQCPDDYVKWIMTLLWDLHLLHNIKTDKTVQSSLIQHVYWQSQHIDTKHIIIQCEISCPYCSLS